MSVQDIAAKMQERVAGSGFDKSVKFDLKGAGVIVIDGQSVSTTDGPADCTIHMSWDDFQSLAAGRLDPMGAYMSGKMKIDGNPMDALALQPVLKG